MKPGSAVLALLRSSPLVAISGWGFITRGFCLGEAVGGGCTLACTQPAGTSIYRIDATYGGPDWYIPFGQSEARHCDVPLGEPTGTLVVTFPMNGCALEVRELDNGNRFYHDSDGTSLPALDSGAPKFRAAYADYAGPANTTHEKALRYFGPDSENRGGYEHDIFCVKKGGNWGVYASAVIRVNDDAWQVKDRVPYLIGTFAD